MLQRASYLVTVQPISHVSIFVVNMDAEQLKAQSVAIKNQLQNVTRAVEEYLQTFEACPSEADLGSMGRLSQCQVDMVDNVKQLQSAIYGPLNMVMLHYEEVS